MPLTDQYVDLSKFPEDEKPHILDVAQKHNALVKRVDLITGETREDKEHMFRVFATVRQIGHFLHTKRFDGTLLLFGLYLLLGNLDRLGIKSEEIGPRVIALLDLILKAGGAK